MRKVISSFVFIVCCALIGSCKKSLNRADYIAYINKPENGLKKNFIIDGFEFAIQYRPTDYVLLVESRNSTVGYDLNKRRTELDGTAWFSIGIRRLDNQTTPMRFGITSAEDYNKRLNYFLNEVQKDLWLTYDHVDIPPTSYLFENNYNLAPQETMLIGFMLPSGTSVPQKEMQLCFNDRVFRSGIIKARYSEEVLHHIPNLVYKN